MSKDGKSVREIGGILNKSHSTVYNILKKYKTTGKVADLPKTGRPAKLNARDIRRIVSDIHKDPSSSAVKIAESLSSDKGVSVSSSTVRRALHANGYHGRVPRKKPFISKVNKGKRLKFAKEHTNSDLNFWNKVLFTDESKFQVFGANKRQKIWRKPNTALDQQNIRPTVKHGGGSVMVWGSMSASGVGNLAFIESTMDRFGYLNILQQNLSTSVEKLNLPHAWIFQQDNDPKPTAKIVKEWLLRNTPEQLSWPPQSPDLSPIEHLWELLDREIRKRNITNLESLKQTLLEEWANISADVTRKLVESIPRRLRAVINNKGGPTKY